MSVTISSRKIRLLLVLLSASFQTCAAEDQIDLSKFHITFQEDFDTLDVSAWGGGDGSRWIAHTPWNGDFGDAPFADPVASFPFTVSQGTLRIEAHKNLDGKWASGLLATTTPQGKGFSQKFGYFEARMKLPSGKGVWPAFWLVGVDRSKLTSEIDVMEYYGRVPTEFSSGIHIWRESHGGKDTTAGNWQNVDNGSLSNSYHTYGVDITAERTEFYFDRKSIWSIKTPKEFETSFYPLVNLALGAGWPIDETPNPSFLLVDYIHVYQRNSHNDEAAARPK